MSIVCSIIQHHVSTYCRKSLRRGMSALQPSLMVVYVVLRKPVLGTSVTHDKGSSQPAMWLYDSSSCITTNHSSVSLLAPTASHHPHLRHTQFSPGSTTASLTRCSMMTRSSGTSQCSSK